MRVEYPDMDLFWIDAVVATMKHGFEFESRVGKCKELIGVSFTLTDIRKNFIVNETRKLSPEYAAGELFWYLGLTNDPTAILAYAPSYKNFLDDGKANGAYGERWKSNPGFKYETAEFEGQEFKSQLSLAYKMLKNDPNTRQCVITMWDSKDLPNAYTKRYKDTPCTLTMQFLVRDNKLNCVVNMRSNDVWLGLPYDVFCFSTIQRIMADALGLDYGWYTHNVGSFHIYEKHYGKIKEGFELGLHEDDSWSKNEPLDRKSARDLIYGTSDLIELERRVRTGKCDFFSPNTSASYIEDLIRCVAHKFNVWYNKHEIVNSCLRNNLKEKS